ncbi:HD domain-containing protein [Asanoa iriomotensis]|uniref:Uncharacterized protein n=1 Tax=Asanoa iriomotensis TaxID=234613 RepID=A0ABQ4BXP0_9ACTN|nr:HD domain-containing protein [Asanoa iriomotensis]GIF55295.1 hypothetical protein Air01nite_13900 [Asanoa iriomotensis]
MKHRGPGLGEAARSVWGKTDRTGTSPAGWLPLWRHLADSADVAGHLWDHWLSASVRRLVEAKPSEDTAAKELKADGFRLDGVAAPGVPPIGWLSGGVGEVDDRAGQGHVRDTDGESVEVLLLVRSPDGLVLPPWIEGGGVPVPIGSVPPWPLPRRIARCTLPLPRAMTSDAVLAELGLRNDLRAWQASHWLAGELVLDVDADGWAALAGFELEYDVDEGLRVTRATA